VNPEEPSGLSRTMAFQAGMPSGGYYMGDTSTSTVITAQIPAVPAGPSYGVLLPDGSIWYPGSQKRLPAPLPLRVAVWTLAFLVVLAAAGDFIIRDHPAWVDPLRRMVPASAVATTPVGSGHKAHHTGSAKGSRSGLSVQETSPQPSGLPSDTTAYTIRGTSAYQAVVKVSQVTWVVAYALSNGHDAGPPLYAGDVQPGHSTTIAASGPVDLETAAAGATVTIMSGGKKIGTLANPSRGYGHYYLEPSGPKH
jgi:hypothetical protein